MFPEGGKGVGIHPSEALSARIFLNGHFDPLLRHLQWRGVEYRETFKRQVRERVSSRDVIHCQHEVMCKDNFNR